jgi:MerR family transcriptional regulator, light-induced transcriptional regulator
LQPAHLYYLEFDMPISKSPAYNLKVVLKETGIFADTLRAWERRYGLPMPQRTAGGHRLYSEYDIQTIKWLMSHQREGLSISRAVDMWNEQNNSGVDPLADSVSQAAATTSTVYRIPETSLDSLRGQWLSACLNFNETEAEEVLNQAFAMYTVEKVCTDVLQHGLSEIGILWYENRASVQQEHFASALAMRRLDTLLSASPRATRKQTVLIGCPSNEWHTFTTLLLALFLRRRGLNVIYLGANVPAEQFEETVSAVGADLVILVAQTLVSAAALHSTALGLMDRNVQIGFGGRIFNTRIGLQEYIPGYFLGASIETAVDEIESVLNGKVHGQEIRTAPSEYLAALQAFNAQRIHIESTLKELVNPLPIDAEGVNTGIHFLGDNIAAALQLGSMEHVSDELEWLKVLMQSHNRPPQELAYFMQSYSNAVDRHINGTGTPIKTWLQERVRQVQP